MKIIVYTIMKNELDNIPEWLINVKDADGIYVLDTGSTDGSYEKMLEMKALYPQLEVEQKCYESFRFDVARNDNLAMVPNDPDTVCWTIDLDERFCDDWYERTLKIAEQYPKFYKLTYWYAARHDEGGNVIDKHIYDKCHRRVGAAWSKPIHEILDYGDHEADYDQGNILIDENEIIVHHYQNLSTDRDQYITLLKKRLEDNRYDIEAMHHLSTEYTKKGDMQAVLDLMFLQYSRGLTCGCDWLETIAGNIAVTLEENYPEEAEMWYQEAIRLNPKLRTYYLKYANFLCYGSSNSRPEKALQVMQSMQDADTIPQEEWKEADGNYSWLVKDTYGVIMSWMANYLEALRYFRAAEKLVESDYSKSIVNYHLNFCLEKIGNGQ